MRSLNAAAIIVAVAAGGAMAYVDTRPGWDDAGITAGILFIAAGLLSFGRPRLAPAIAVAVGAWIPIIEITRAGNFGALLALGVAAVGALCGAGARIMLSPRGAATR